MNSYQVKRIKGCLKKERMLTAWEIDFLENLESRSEDEDYDLSDKQNKYLNGIAARVGG